MRIDFAFAQTLLQFFGRDVDDLDVIGEIEKAVRHGLAHAHLRNSGDDIVRALEMLHIHRGKDIHAGGEDFLHVHPSLWMAHAVDVRVRQIIDQDELRLSFQDRVEIQFLERLSAMRIKWRMTA